MASCALTRSCDARKLAVRCRSSLVCCRDRAPTPDVASSDHLPRRLLRTRRPIKPHRGTVSLTPRGFLQRPLFPTRPRDAVSSSRTRIPMGSGPKQASALSDARKQGSIFLAALGTRQNRVILYAKPPTGGGSRVRPGATAAPLPGGPHSRRHRSSRRAVPRRRAARRFTARARRTLPYGE